jgi:pimeloyl-ACP methyl ester carboxylesterase
MKMPRLFERSCVVAATLIVLAAPLLGQDQYFDSDGVRIRYVVEGTGEPIVLVHGFGGSLEAWRGVDILQNLSRDHQVIAFDMRGHGKSAKPHDPKLYGRQMSVDIVRLMDHLHIHRAHIVGYSMGGMVTSQLLTLRPERFLTATLIAGPGRFDWTPEDQRIADLEAGEIERDCISRSLLERMGPASGPKPSEQQVHALSATCMADSTRDRFALAAVTRSRADQSVSPAAAAVVKVPTLGVVGSLDGMRAGMERLKKLRPDMQLVIVDGATHGGERGILSRPELIAALRQFLATNHVKPGTAAH